MRILVYGGCHAAVLQRVLANYGPSDVDVQLITNFRLIASGKPFPFEAVDESDMVILNPILNRPEYDTKLVEARCDARGIPYFNYTWLQWNGYHPGFAQVRSDVYNGWWCKALAAEAPNYASFADFYATVEDGTILRDIIQAELTKTSNALRAREDAGDAHIRLTDYILENYRRQRLFLTPDHPSNVVYQYVFERLRDIAGLEIDIDLTTLDRELQYGVEVPVLPSVVQELDLEFEAREFCHRPTWGPVRFDLEEFALLHYDQQAFADRVSERQASEADATDILVT